MKNRPERDGCSKALEVMRASSMPYKVCAAVLDIIASTANTACSLNYTNFCESAPVHEDGCSGDRLRHIDSRFDLELPCYRRSQCRVVLEGRPCAKVSGLSRLSLMLSTFRKQGCDLSLSFAKVC